MAMPGQPLQCARVGEQCKMARIQVHAVAEVGHIGEAPTLPLPGQPLGHRRLEPVDHPESEADFRIYRPITAGKLQCAIPLAVTYVHRPYLDPMAARV